MTCGDLSQEVFQLVPVGVVHTPFPTIEEAPKQGTEVDAVGEIRIYTEFAEGLGDIRPGDRLYVLLWLHQSKRNVLLVHPRGDASRPLAGVFSTRSPNRPNPIGLCLVHVVHVEGCRIQVRGLDALDKTPVIDIKPYMVSLDR